jgi:hypothetical protein
VNRGQYNFFGKNRKGENVMGQDRKLNILAAAFFVASTIGFNAQASESWQQEDPRQYPFGAPLFVHENCGGFGPSPEYVQLCFDDFGKKVNHVIVRPPGPISREQMIVIVLSHQKQEELGYNRRPRNIIDCLYLKDDLGPTLSGDYNFEGDGELTLVLERDLKKKEMGSCMRVARESFVLLRRMPPGTILTPAAPALLPQQ